MRARTCLALTGLLLFLPACDEVHAKMRELHGQEKAETATETPAPSADAKDAK